MRRRCSRCTPPPSGAHTLTLHLRPQELGRVQVRIERVPGGPAQVAVSAERPETLDLLRRDSAALHRALAQTGIVPGGHGIRFHLAVPDAGSAAPAQPGAPAPDANGFGLAGSGQGSAGSPGNGRRNQGSGRNRIDTERAPPWLPPTHAGAPWPRSALDLTA